MIDIQSFCKNIHTQDTVFHYTKVKTAIDSILKDNTLKFSERAKAKDPTESISADCYVHSDLIGNEENYELMCAKNRDKAFLLVDKIRKEAKKYGQISFCRNANVDFDFLNYGGDTFLNYEEKYGFTKPRMWEQYAEEYKGVCLAFSKTKINEINSGPNIKHDNVTYHKYKKLLLKDLSVNMNVHDHIGGSEYDIILQERMKQYLFWKHKDYEGESEYKICAKDSYTSYPYLYIQECLQGIIVSHQAEWEDKESLLEYAEKFKVPIFEIKWTHNSIKLNDFKHTYNVCQNMVDSEKKETESSLD